MILKRFFLFAVVAGVLGGVAYAAIVLLEPCGRPIVYHIAQVDSRFGISTDAFTRAVERAAKVWSDAAGRTLFQRMSDGGIAISAVYDYRQETQKQLEKLGIRLDEGQQSYEEWKSKYDRLRSLYESRQGEYQVLQRQYDTQSKAYDVAVTQAKKNGVSTAEFEALEARRVALNTLIGRLNAKAQEVRDMADATNAIIATLNDLGQEANQLIDTYRDTQAPLHDEFQAGVYTRDRNGERVEIFAFDDLADLERLLVHELGHALGLEHLNETGAVMYRLNQSRNEILTDADRLELSRVCRL